jgi:Protein of unknown function (DUF4058)
MPSPFPGMNPYFEQPGIWRGFHGLLLGQLTFALNSRVTPRYHADYEESLYIDQPQPTDRTFFAVADVGVAEGDDEPLRETGGGTAVAARPRANPVPATVTAGIKKKHRWLTIRDTQNREIVTVIEVLSPSNKTSTDDRAQYLRRRRKLLHSKVNLVEIDLLRGGEPMPMNGVPDCDYRIMVARRGRRPNVDVWPVGLRETLPEIPIPLAGTDPDVWLDLKPVLDAVYDGGAYRYRLYDHPPDPPLTVDDAAWATELVKAG